MYIDILRPWMHRKNNQGDKRGHLSLPILVSTVLFWATTTTTTAALLSTVKVVHS